MTTTTRRSSGDGRHGHIADPPLVVFPFGEPDGRLEDFLDDKLQSAGDLATIDELLASVGEQNALLQSQLEEAAEAVAVARGGAEAADTALRAQLDEFATLERAVDERLAAVRASDAPATTMARLEQPLRQLERVSVAQQYLELLVDVDGWAKAARAQLPGDPRAALEPYGRLRRLVQTMEGSGVDDAASLHLAAYVRQVVDQLWTEMNTTMRAEMEALLEQRRWPVGIDPAVRADETWRDVFAKLVDLQAHEILARATTPTPTPTSPTDALPLLPIDVMAQIYVREFRYHFLTTGRKTSDPRQIADVCFPWFLERVENWADFLRDSFADLLAMRFTGTAAGLADDEDNDENETDTDTITLYTDPVCAFVAALLPVMREKVARTVAYALQQLDEQPSAGQPSFFGSLVVQLHVFDDELRTRFGYDGGVRTSAGGWPGLAADVLTSHFDRWLQAEKELALARYRDAVESEDGRTLDYDYGSTTTAARRSKPTLAAERVMDLLRALTDQYRRVRRFGHRLRFLVDIQVTILDAFDDRLRGALEAYGTMTSTVGRTFNGVTREQLAALAGTGGLETLCRVYGSAEYVMQTLRDWGDEEFFVRLWDELQSRTADGARTRGADEPQTLFDETIQSFGQRRDAARGFLVSALAESQRKAFRPYALRTQWTTVSESEGGGGADLTITAELDEPLRVLQRNLAFLARALGTTALRRVVRGGLEKLQDLLWSEVLMAHSFSALGAAQLARDIGAVSALVEQIVPRSAGALEGLRQGVQLLNVPVEADHILTLQTVSDRVFVDNAEAKKVLQELGLTMLTPADARQVLQRRVENA